MWGGWGWGVGLGGGGGEINENIFILFLIERWICYFFSIFCSVNFELVVNDFDFCMNFLVVLFILIVVGCEVIR